MTTTLSNPRPAVRPSPIIAAALMVAALVVLVFAVTVWGSGGSDVDAPAPRIATPTGAVWGSGGSDVDAPAPRIATPTGAVRDPTAATQAYRDRLHALNTTLDGYSNRPVRASSLDSGEAACGPTGPC